MRYDIHKNFIKIFLPYIQKDQLKECGSVMWIPEERCYYAPHNLKFLKNFIKSFNIKSKVLYELQDKIFKDIMYSKKVITYYRYLRENSNIEPPELIKNFPYKEYKPYRHQQLSLYVATMLPRFGLFLDAGTGKTRVMLDAICYRVLNSSVKSILVVCPKINIKNTWIKEVKKHSILNIPTIPIFNESSKDKKEILANRPEGPFMHIITYDCMRINLKYMSDYDMVIFDESRRLGDTRSQRSAAALKFSLKAKYSILATGTVNTLASFKDVFSQYKVLDFGQSFGLNYLAFMEDYFQDIGSKFTKWVLKKDSISSIRNVMYTKAISYRKEECLDLPGQVFKYIEVEPSKKQAKLSSQFTMACFKPEVKKEYNLDNNAENAEIIDALPISKVIKLQEINSGFYKPFSDAANIFSFPTGKLSALSDVLSETGDDKLIIWVRFKHDIDIIYKELEKQGIGCCRLSGDFDEIEDWQNLKANRVLVGMESMGIGLNLVEAKYVVYWSYDYSLDRWNQSLDRVYRIGQKFKVTYFIFMIKESVDIGIIFALKNNDRISRRLTDYEFRRLAKGKNFKK